VPADAYLRKHPETGMFYLNKRVPVDVAAAFGRAKVLESLNKKDRPEARKRRNIRLGELEKAFGELRRTGKAEQALAEKVARRDLSKLSRAELERLVTATMGTCSPPSHQARQRTAKTVPSSLRNGPKRLLG